MVRHVRALIPSRWPTVRPRPLAAIAVDRMLPAEQGIQGLLSSGHFALLYLPLCSTRGSRSEFLEQDPLCKIGRQLPQRWVSKPTRHLRQCANHILPDYVSPSRRSPTSSLRRDTLADFPCPTTCLCRSAPHLHQTDSLPLRVVVQTGDSLASVAASGGHS